MFQTYFQYVTISFVRSSKAQFRADRDVTLHTYRICRQSKVQAPGCRETSALKSPECVQKLMLLSSICRSSAKHRHHVDGRTELFSRKNSQHCRPGRENLVTLANLDALQENCDF